MKLKPWITWKGKDIVCGFLSRFLWPRSSAVALVFDEEKILAIDTGDYFMLPGGALEHGESFKDTAKRETREETGYEIELRDKVSEGINSVGGAEKIFSATLGQKEQVSSGNWEGEPVWIKPEGAANRKWRHNRDVESLIDKCKKQS